MGRSGLPDEAAGPFPAVPSFAASPSQGLQHPTVLTMQRWPARQTQQPPSGRCALWLSHDQILQPTLWLSGPFPCGLLTCSVTCEAKLEARPWTLWASPADP